MAGVKHQSKSMFYWNRDNFEGLKSVGEKYSSIDGYELFGKYCLQKEQGLKKLAIVSIKEFVADAKKRSLYEQRKLAEELSTLGFWNGEIHQLLPHPLVEFLKVVLQHWVADEPENPIPYKWLGFVAGDISYYERALEFDPKDEICITRVAQAHLNDVDYQTHHLSESLFIGKYGDAIASFGQAQSLVDSLSSKDTKAKMQSELDYYNRLLSSWCEFSKLEINETFPNWCASKGEEFNFWSIVYYDR
jgi:tetratricopeptide (TPR) repeat protein